MKYHELQVEPNKNKKRVGRGISAGQGKTAGRGTKGQGSRTGKKLKVGFMGGQRALMQAVPKARGFKSKRIPAQVVYLEDLQVFDGKKVDSFTLFEAGLATTPYRTIKVIVKGDFSAKITLSVPSASKSAQELIAKAGGSFTKVAVPLKQATKAKEEKAK